MQRRSPPGVISRQTPVSQSVSPEHSVSSGNDIVIPVLVDDVVVEVVLVVVVPLEVVLVVLPPPEAVPVLALPPEPVAVPAYSQRPSELHT